MFIDNTPLSTTGDSELFATMAPPAKTLERDLKKAVRELFDTDELTVNAVRKRVEEMHNLDEDFFSAPEWKNRSKTIIKDFLVRYSSPVEPFQIHPRKFVCAWPRGTLQILTPHHFM